MHKALLILTALLVVGAFAGCTGVVAPVVPPRAAIYTHFNAPLQTHYEGADLGTKKGETKCRGIGILFWPSPDVAWGDSAIRQAAKEGNISTVKAVDYEYLNVLWVYQEFTVHAYGD